MQEERGPKRKKFQSDTGNAKPIPPQFGE
ncbi:uncharacterized protein G2W53_011443 [Senna tora]|uniref:Uncharacterized protein n=1 Tax=Senna tora TaxID=362788 RepID=A0A834X260_9FABA|nr:uncharacterized protein G2W53_011443 [Senna tora]